MNYSISRYAKQSTSSWVSHETWKCHRHIPSSLAYPAFVEKCPSCKQPRPSQDMRPEFVPLPPTKGVPSSIITSADIYTNFLRDPEWTQGPAIITLPQEVPAPRVIAADPEVLREVARVTVEALENMRLHRDVNAELNTPTDFETDVGGPSFDKDMSLGQAQRDLDATVMEDLLVDTQDPPATSDDRVCPKCGGDPFIGPCNMAADFLEPTATPHQDIPAPAQKAPKKVIRASRAVCPGRGCRKWARPNSPYCSKICSDRCLRIRKKAKSGVELSKDERAVLDRIMRALEASK